MVYLPKWLDLSNVLLAQVASTDLLAQWARLISFFTRISGSTYQIFYLLKLLHLYKNVPLSQVA
jgi:hypothetical protein